MILLSFHALLNGPAVVVRGAHFRICSDGTLRGPDNTRAARYVDGLWHLGDRPHLSFECAGPLYLRVTNSDGRRECIGPYTNLRVAEGAIFAQNSCLGIHAVRPQMQTGRDEMWHEVSFLTSM